MYKECFICCTYSGKSEEEEHLDFEMNVPTPIYPLISLSTAYYCLCKKTFAHNRCLLSIRNWPTCRN